MAEKRNYMDIFEDDAVFSGGSPKQKFFEIVYTANRNVVEMELEKLLERFALAEKILEERGLEQELEQRLSRLPGEPCEEVENIKTSLLIETTGSIVCQSE